MENFNLLEFIIGCGVLITGYMLSRYVKNSDDNNKKQWEKLEDHDARVTTLETEHKIIKESGGCVHWHARASDRSGEDHGRFDKKLQP